MLSPLIDLMRILGRKELLDGMLGANLVCFQVRFIGLPPFLLLTFMNRPTPTVATSSRPASVYAVMKPIQAESMSTDMLPLLCIVRWV